MVGRPGGGGPPLDDDASSSLLPPNPKIPAATGSILPPNDEAGRLSPGERINDTADIHNRIVDKFSIRVILRDLSLTDGEGM